MSFTADEIESIVEQINVLKKDYTIEQINQMECFNDFRTKNKMFYNMIVSPQGTDPIIFKEMMKMKRRLEAGEDQYSVDVKFGRYMASKYIDPVISKK